MELSNFKIRQLVFEVRYDDAFLLWDCAGRTNAELAKIWPGTRLDEASPNQQSIKSDKLSIVTGINSSRVVLICPTTIVQYSDQLAETIKLWIEFLGISEFTRIGTRVIYDREYDSEESVNSAIIDLGLVNYPAAPFFNHKEKPFASDIRLLWKDEVSQTQILIKAERHQLEIGGLPSNPLQKEVRISDHLLVDVDRSTHGLVEVAKFRVSEWMNGVRHLIARDLPKLLKAS